MRIYKAALAPMIRLHLNMYSFVRSYENEYVVDWTSKGSLITEAKKLQRRPCSVAVLMIPNVVDHLVVELDDDGDYHHQINRRS